MPWNARYRQPRQLTQPAFQTRSELQFTQRMILGLSLMT